MSPGFNPLSRRQPAQQYALSQNLRAIGVILALLSFAGAAAGVWDMYRHRIAAAHSDMRLLSGVLAAHITSDVRQIDRVLERVRDRARDLRLETPGTFRDAMRRDDTRTFLNQISLTLPPNHFFEVLDTTGAQLNQTGDPAPAEAGLGHGAYVREFRDNPNAEAWFNVVRSTSDNGSKTVIIARGIHAKSGEFLGLAVIGIRIEHLTDSFRALYQDRRIEFTLLRPDGRILAHFPDLNPAIHAMPADSPWYDRVAERGGVYHSPGYLLDSEVIVAVAPLTEYQLVIDVLIRERDVLAGWSYDAAYVIFTAVLLACAFIALFWVIAGQLRRQFQQHTALTAASSAIAASDARLRDFLELASDWLWEQDARLRFSWSSATTDRSDVAISSGAGKLRWDYYDISHDPEGWRRHREDVEAHRPFLNHRFRVTSPDGTIRYRGISGRPLHDATGAFIGYRGIGRDVTAQVMAERELVDAKDRAEKAENLLRDAIDSLSESLTIWDKDDRLVAYNECYADRYPDALKLMHPGIHYLDMLRRRLAAGEFPDAIGQEAAWMTEARRRHQAVSGSYEHRMADGRWTKMTQRRMRNGGTVMLYVDITDLKETEIALRKSEEHFDRAQLVAGVGTWEMDVMTGNFYWSKQVYLMHGLDSSHYAPAQGVVRPTTHPEDSLAVTQWLRDLETGVARQPIESRLLRADGQYRLHRSEGRAVVGPHGRAIRLIGTVQDISEQRSMEQQLAHARKMETIGNLTGGLAHDFNNLLGILMINLDSLEILLKDDAKAAPLLAGCLNAATSGAGLTQQLLAFARRQTLRPVIVDVNEMTRRIASLLRHTIDPSITMTLDLTAAPWPVFVDAAQLESSIINLAMNARDAMPSGGTLTIATAPRTIDAAEAESNPGLMPGDHMTITVEDDGIGMAPGIEERIFEPFFTTKDRGQGTGLGLSMVFGFMRQSNGAITVSSRPGFGTTCQLMLPRSMSARGTDLAPTSAKINQGGNETILIVEDNRLLREALLAQIGSLNYKVLEAADADRAVDVLETNAIDLVLTDVVMPGRLDGIALAKIIQQRWPRTGVILTSGFVDTKQNGGAAALPPGIVFMRKPARYADLARALRVALDAQGR